MWNIKRKKIVAVEYYDVGITIFKSSLKFLKKIDTNVRISIEFLICYCFRVIAIFLVVKVTASNFFRSNRIDVV